MKVYNAVPLAIDAEAGWKPYRTVTFGKYRVTGVYSLPMTKYQIRSSSIPKRTEARWGITPDRRFSFDTV